MLLPRGSFHILKADYRLRVVIDLDPFLKLRPNWDMRCLVKVHEARL